MNNFNREDLLRFMGLGEEVQALEMQEDMNLAKLRRKTEKGLRHHLISKLTDKREKMVAMYKYSSDGSYIKESERGMVDVIESGMTFEPGDEETLIRVLVRPDMPKIAVLEALHVITKEVSDHKGENWMAEFDDAVGKVATNLKSTKRAKQEQTHGT